MISATIKNWVLPSKENKTSIQNEEKPGETILSSPAESKTYI